MHIKIKDGVIVRLTDEGTELVVDACEADAIARANGCQFAEQFVQKFGPRAKERVIKIDDARRVTIKLEDWERALCYFHLLDPTMPRPIGKANQVKFLARMMNWDEERASTAIDVCFVRGAIDDKGGK